MIRASTALGAALLIAGCEPTPPAQISSTQASQPAQPASLRPSPVPVSTTLIQPIRIGATLDGAPLNLENTVTSCARDDKSGIEAGATNPLGTSTNTLRLRIHDGRADVSVITDNSEMNSAPTTPVTLVQTGSDYTVSGQVFRVSQRGWDTVPHAFTANVSCAPGSPVRTDRYAQPVAVAATLDGVRVDLRDTIPYCAYDGGPNSYFTIAASSSPTTAGRHPSFSVIINRSTLAVSHGRLEGAGHSRDFRGDGPSHTSWRMKVVKEGTVYRVTGVDDRSGGSVEIVADCAGL
ncbi:hypothetical protein BI330_18580 [Mycobacterium sp. CBMA 623]|nr:hypothetical protein [Mycobacteroides sp. CBMA 326]